MARIIIWFVFIFGGAACGIVADLKYFSNLFRSVIFHSMTIVFGLIVLWIVMVISRNTGKYLAKHGREGNVPRLDTNKFVKTGMYSCMRHPMHFGLLFFPLAFALIIGSPSFIFFIAPFEALLMVIMIKLLEEPEAIKKFGDEYREYMKEVPMFNLSWNCLKLLFKKQGSITEN